MLILETLVLLIACAVALGWLARRFDIAYPIMLVPMLVVLAAIIVWPDIPLFLPRLISPEFLK